MEQSDKDTGTLAALMLNLEEVRLPRAMRILERVNGGGLLSKRDIRFLKKVYRDSRINVRLIKRHPEYSGLISRCFVLYTEIITKGLENEKAR
jgi:hypothetical protein